MLLHRVTLLCLVYIWNTVFAAPNRESTVCFGPNQPLASYTYDGDIEEAAVGTVLTVRCKDPYTEGSPVITCRDGRWSEPEPLCKLVYCVFPKLPVNGYFKGDCRHFKCKGVYSCPEGYWYTGTVTTYCQRDEQWSGVPGECKAGTVCHKPDNPYASYVYDGDIKEAGLGTELTVKCKDQYKEGSPVITCTDGRWSDPDPPCQLVNCISPKISLPGSIEVTCHHFNCMAVYSCPEGYLYTGTVTTYCQRDEQWSGVSGECEAVICPELSPPPDGKVIYANRSYSAEAIIQCNEGYTHSKSRNISVTCQGNNTWSGGVVVCKPVRCPRLVELYNGMISQPNSSFMAIAELGCDDGYIYNKPDFMTRTCQADGTWSGEDGRCEGVKCSEIPEVENGILSGRDGRFKDTLTLQCPSGHILDGPSTITCQGDGTWTTEFGTCLKPSSNLAVALSVTILLVVVIAFVGVIYYMRKRDKRYKQVPQLDSDKSELFISFKLTEDFSEEYDSDDSADCQVFKNLIQDKISDVIKSGLEMSSEVVVTHIITLQKDVFVTITSQHLLRKEDVQCVLANVSIEAGKDRKTHIDIDSVVFREKISHALAAEIRIIQHHPDKPGDRVIDFETQYVRLKLLPNGTLDAKCRDRPDLYQRDLEKEDGVEIQDDDLIKAQQTQNYTVIRGRAGIGKSTLVQRLLWKWANGNLAATFEAIFMLNIRFLMKYKKKISLGDLLSLYSVYSTKAGLIDAAWLNNTQGRVGIIVDGIDEIEDFKRRWETKDTSLNIDSVAKPIDWCFALMKREILPRTTMMVSSRPFADLGLIEKHMRKLDLFKHLSLVELMGLTRGRVMEFVERNVEPERKELVKKTLENNPILLSVSAITFYCAALCKVLGKEGTINVTLRTYTRITAYIMQEYMKRSFDVQDGISTSNATWERTLRLLCQLASRGLLGDNSRDVAQLVFHQDDLQDLEINSDDLHKMRKSGLLMETTFQDPDDKKNVISQSQFVHLSIQEYLAMVGLLQEGSERIGSLVKRLCKSGQFNMALLFLYGLAFDCDDPTMESMFPRANKVSQETTSVLMNEVDNIPSSLQALQVAHESQSEHVAKKVGSKTLDKEEVSMTGTKLTAIDIIAMTFVLWQHPFGKTIRLEHTDLDITSVTELAKFLKEDKIVEKLNLNDHNVNDPCISILMDYLKNNSSLKSLSLTSKCVTDEGLEKVAESLEENQRLQKLSIDFDLVTDGGVANLARSLDHKGSALEELHLSSEEISKGSLSEIAKLLHKTPLKSLSLRSHGITDDGVTIFCDVLSTNTTLQQLRLYSENITDKGVDCITGSLHDHRPLTQLWLLGFQMEVDGAKAILELLEVKEGLHVRIREPECPEALLSRMEVHKNITMD